MVQKKPVLLLYLLAATAWIGWNSLHAAESIPLIRLADNVYVRIVNPDGNAVANSGVVVLDDAVLVFDTHFTPEAGRALLEAIRAITPKPVRYVVNSHSHPDHTHGNAAFAGAQLIASGSARRDILEVDLPSLNRTISAARNQLEHLRRDVSGMSDPVRARRDRDLIRSREKYLNDLENLRILAPFVTFEDSLTIRDGGMEARMLFLGKGHTDGDIVLVLPSAKIAFVGDLFFNEAIPNVKDASILEWMTTLRDVLKLEADIFVPGHGPVGDRKAVEKFLRYFEDLQALVRPAVARGDSMEQATEELRVPGKYSTYQFQNLFPANIQKMYAELRGPQAPPSSPSERKKR